MDYKFKGVCPVMNLPFRADGSIDHEDMAKEAEMLISAGCESICLFAFNSEPHKLSFDEKLDTIGRFLGIIGRRVQTLIGIVENSISGAKLLAQAAEKGGADGIILYPPSLSTPSGDALLDYFKQIAGSVSIDVMIQDNPRSTGVSMTMEFLLKAFREIDNFNYLKVECPIPVRKLRRICELTEGKLKCYSGNGGIFAVNAFLNGAWGIMPGAVTAPEFIKLHGLIESGKTDEARALFEKLLPLVWFEDQSLEFYVACEKELLRHMGVFKTSVCRDPGETLCEADLNELYALYGRVK